MKKNTAILFLTLSFIALSVCAQKIKSTSILTGADQTEKYLPLLKGKRVGMVVNPTSIIGTQTTVDSLLKRGVNIVKIFGPEHGFRGNASTAPTGRDR